MEDVAVTALNAAGRTLPCRASLTLASTPAREVRLPRRAVIVSIPLALAAAADLLRHDGAPPVTLELRGQLLSVQQGAYLGTFDLRGETVPDEPALLPAGEMRLVCRAAELAREIADAVARGEVEVTLSGTAPDGPGRRAPLSS
jgi:hypothetical protein